MPYNQYENLRFDSEEKITEFNYENYIPEVLLAQKEILQTEGFKDLIKATNMLTKTKYEEHKDN